MIGGIQMQITDVRVRKIEKEGKMKAIVSITLDNEFVVMAENELMINTKIYKHDIDKLLNNMMIREISDEL